MSPETTALWSEVNQSQAAARAKRKEANLAILRASSVRFAYFNDNGRVMPPAGYPVCEYFPAVGYWKYNGRHILGDATAFLEWLERKRKA